jgi:hypothetical protein
MRSGATSPRCGFFRDFFGDDFVVGMDGELWLRSSLEGVPLPPVLSGNKSLYIMELRARVALILT